MSETNVNIKQIVKVVLERQRQLMIPVKPSGTLKTELWRAGRIIDTREVKNGVTTVGKNSMLDTFFRNVAPAAAWYHGLIDNASYSAVAATDTMASHAGWLEFTGYSQATRPQWSPGAAAAASLTNAVSMDFSITSAATLQGGFIVTNSTKSGTTGVLWATALYGTPLVVANGDTVRNTYTTSLT